MDTGLGRIRILNPVPCFFLSLLLGYKQRPKVVSFHFPVSPVSVIVPDAQENTAICRMDECVSLVEGNKFSYCRDLLLSQTPLQPL